VGPWKPVVPWIRLEIGFYSLFVCLRAEMFLRYRQTFPGKEKCLLGQLSPFGDSCSLSFKTASGMHESTGAEEQGCPGHFGGEQSLED
jgi:hypothetical protein